MGTGARRNYREVYIIRVVCLDERPILGDVLLERETRLVLHGTGDCLYKTVVEHIHMEYDV